VKQCSPDLILKTGVLSGWFIFIILYFWVKSSWFWR